VRRAVEPARKGAPTYGHETLRRAGGCRALAGESKVGLATPGGDAGGSLPSSRARCSAPTPTGLSGHERGAHQAAVEVVHADRPPRGTSAAKAAVARAHTVVEAVHWPRDLGQRSPADLLPAVFADEAIAAAEGGRGDRGGARREGLKKAGTAASSASGRARPGRLGWSS
jgi:hypothetical protein